METITGFDFFLTTLLPPQFSFLLKDPKTPKQLLVKRRKGKSGHIKGSGGSRANITHLVVTTSFNLRRSSVPIVFSKFSNYAGLRFLFDSCSINSAV